MTGAYSSSLAIAFEAPQRDGATSSPAVDDGVIQVEIVVGQSLLRLRCAGEPQRDADDGCGATLGLPQQIQKMRECRRGVADRDDRTIE